MEGFKRRDEMQIGYVSKGSQNVGQWIRKQAVVVVL